MKKTLSSRWLSRKFILSIISAIIVFGNSAFDWGLNLEQTIAVISPLLAFIAIEGIADIKERK